MGFGIDTEGDGTRVFEFFNNPLGVQGDAIATLELGEKFSFDAIWESKGTITDDGFIVEVAVPLSRIRFTQKDGPQNWKIFLTQTYPRDRRYQAFGHPIDRDKACWTCQFQPVTGFVGAKPGERFQFIPSLTANRRET